MRIYTYQQASHVWLNLSTALEGYIAKRVKDLTLAEEINQQVLHKVLNSCCSNKDIHNIRSWLFQIAHNATIDYLKEQSKYTDSVPTLTDEPEHFPYQELENSLPDLIDLLPENYSIPLRMADLEELKHKEIAARLSLSLSAVKSRVLRGRLQLKQLIEEHFQKELESGEWLPREKKC